MFLEPITDVLGMILDSWNRCAYLKVFDFAIDALAHDSAEVRTAACIFLKNIFCSVKNLSTGHFMSETVVLPLVQILCDSCMPVQISALRAISNVAVDFKQHKSLFTQSKWVNIWVFFQSRWNAIYVWGVYFFLMDTSFTGIANHSVQVHLGKFTTTTGISIPFMCHLCDLHCTGVPFPFTSSHLCAFHFNETSIVSYTCMHF
ncbi:armadillo repeat-containing protein 8 [Dorcoceras hygrometricum]|uniref:Armadillo repeat-containing protein 8 n=1 Tax=Dorcoceras hygrometricum TaxID=472368 RepID=A0A2Z7ATL4_9LAMI|nr:armadillo repeat-containing protein 8 [Dorcoceras hygrometricum]